MLKKLSVILFFCLISSLAFAQTAPKQVLSEKDITGFITNYQKIMDALDALGDKYDHLFKELENSPVFETMIKMRTIAVPAEVQDILKKNGLGDNGFEKAMVIIQGVGVIFMEEDINSMNAEAAANPKMAEAIKEAKASIKPLKDSINAKDLALINNKKDELYKLLQ